MTVVTPDEQAQAVERMTYREALRLALREELSRDERVFIMGEEVGVFEGSYKVTAGLMAEFGADRVRDTPISEEGFVGAGVGAAMLGERPVVEIMTLNFLLVAMDQVVNHAAKIGAMFGGEVRCPMVIRTPNGAGNQLTAQHSQSFDGWFAGTPGLKVVTPSNPADAKGLLKAAIRDEDPVLVIENLPIYKEKGDVPLDPEFVTPIGRAAVARQGSDLTIVSHSFATVRALHVAEQLAADGIDAEVIDLRSLRPLDMETVAASVAKTNRALCVEEGWPSYGVTAELAARISKACFDDLDAPVERVGMAEVPLALREEPRDGGDAERGPDRRGRPLRPGVAVLHVTNGRSAAARIRAARPGADVLPWDDVLHEGPLASGPGARAVRARFLAAHGWGDAAALEDALARRDARLARAVGGGEPVVLWFEHDLYDQLQLLQVLTALGDAPAELIQSTAFLGPAGTDLDALWAGAGAGHAGAARAGGHRLGRADRRRRLRRGHLRAAVPRRRARAVAGGARAAPADRQPSCSPRSRPARATPPRCSPPTRPPRRRRSSATRGASPGSTRWPRPGWSRPSTGRCRSRPRAATTIASRRYGSRSRGRRPA